MKKLRIYIDTSVIGGCLDEEFAQESHELLELAKRSEIILVISDLLAAEVSRAPEEVKKVFYALPEESIEMVSRSPETERLRDLYLNAGVLGEKSRDDAHHVAIATVEQVDILLSWNFKHLVHFDKICGFNSINIREGYPMIEIHNPKEVV